MIKETISKTADLLSNISKEPFVLNEVTYNPPENIYCSPTLFREFECTMCGWCCLLGNISLEYYPYEMEKINQTSIGSLLSKKEITVNNESKHLFVLDQSQTKLCKFLHENKCSIHEYSPFNCRLAPLKTIRKKKNGYFMKSSYGRKWIQRKDQFSNPTAAQCIFRPNIVTQLNHDIDLFTEFLLLANYFGIETWLPELILFLKNCKDSKYIPTTSVLIGKNNS